MKMTKRNHELAVEGYRLLSSDTANFAAVAFPLAMESWTEWEDVTPAPSCATQELNLNSSIDPFEPS
jgi:hypothetical protein